MLSNKLLIISGPTATGKTALALKLAKKYNGEIISADSRQIYKGMDIGTGKDHPLNTKIHLIDIVNPEQTYSSAEFRRDALSIIADIASRNKLPIVVGGTGHYIDSLINPRPTFTIKPNYVLRFFLNKLPLTVLQKIYSLIDKNNYQKLNNSDVHNPHRLIRKIEIKLSRRDVTCNVSTSDNNFDFLHLSLTAPNSFLFPRIDARVQDRLDMGLLNEIKALLKKYSWSSPGLNCLAYKDFMPYFVKTRHATSLLDTCIKTWAIHEHQYARRQKTWFKKISPIRFFDVSKKNYQKSIIEIIDKWYNKL